MTRINVGINPKKLTDKHLLAEHREIKRIPNMVKSGKAKMDNIPDTFTLGKGHVKFFYNKLGYLYRRYAKIHNECKRRGFNVTDYSQAWDNISVAYYNDLKCTPEAKALILERINLRLSGVK